MNEPNEKIINLSDARKTAVEVVATAIAAESTITQDGIARIFASRYADRLRFCHSIGAWYEWTGTHWKRDETNRAFEFVRLIARELSEGREARELKGLRTTAFASGVERFSRSDPVFAITAAAWDRDPFQLGTPGGTVDLKAGNLRAGLPGDCITRLTAVAPAPATDCPIWLKFLDDATAGDVGLVRHLQQWCGYALTGETREHALVFLYGPGGNGKTVFLNTVTGIMADYAVTASMDTFTASTGDRHPTDLAMLRGARLVAASETEQGRAWAEARIKHVTGGDPITARFMKRDFFTFTPTFKLTIVGNHQPTLASVDDAVRRRFNIVPFPHKPARPDHELEQKLRSEWPGILRWMIDGCLDWQLGGLVRPQVVMKATDDYFDEQDLLGQWLAACCEVQSGNDRMKSTSTALYASWQGFLKAAGQKPETLKAFSQNLTKRGFEPYRDKHGRGFKGITLCPSEGDG
jgi:putative DNA primase/helicase